MYALGGGKDLATAAGFHESRDNKIKQEQQETNKNVLPAKMQQQQQQLPNMMNKMQQNMLPQHFDFMRNPQQSK